MRLSEELKLKIWQVWNQVTIIIIIDFIMNLIWFCKMDETCLL